MERQVGRRGRRGGVFPPPPEPTPQSITYVYVIDKGSGGEGGFSTYILIFMYKYIIYILKT